MLRKNRSLIIPVENQVRELDGRLLFACLATSHGFGSTIGPRHEINYRVASFPAGVYIAHSMSGNSPILFRMVRGAGHEIMGWDEEALVHPPADIYYSRRFSYEAVKHISHLFAWGEENADMWRRYKKLPPGAKIHITGNPRGDLLRPEIRFFYEKDVNRLRDKYGDFILINTNFNGVNSFYSYLNLFRPVNKAGQAPEFGAAAIGMTREFAEGLRDHKQVLFESFKQLIPSLSKAFPDVTIIVRPHPSENFDPYHKISEHCPNTRVIHKGGVTPWLLAAKVLIHNGCTTGVEARLLGTPAISYRSGANESYDYGFFRLPNLLSHQCLNFEQLESTIFKIFQGESSVANGVAHKDLIERYLSAQDGPMACQRILDVISSNFKDAFAVKRLSPRGRLNRWLVANELRFIKLLVPYLPRSHNRPEFLSHRYPEITLSEVRDRVSRFQSILGIGKNIKVDEISHQIFRLAT